jgi:hypothetical protein
MSDQRRIGFALEAAKPGWSCVYVHDSGLGPRSGMWVEVSQRAKWGGNGHNGHKRAQRAQQTQRAPRAQMETDGQMDRQAHASGRSCPPGGGEFLTGPSPVRSSRPFLPPEGRAIVITDSPRVFVRPVDLSISNTVITANTQDYALDASNVSGCRAFLSDA